MNGRVGAAAVMTAVVAAACASGSPNYSGPRQEQVVRTDGSFTMSMPVNRSDAVYTDTVRVNGARAWAELPVVYRTLGLPVNEADGANRRIGVVAFEPRRLEGQAVSSFLDCGRGPTTGEYADSYQVYLWVETSLVFDEADPSRSTVRSTLRANARPRAIAGNPVPCQSRGLLERRIVELLVARTAPAGG